MVRTADDAPTVTARDGAAPQAPRGNPARPVFVLLAALLAVGTYVPGLWNDFVYDDHEVIGNQSAPRSVGDVARIFRERHFPELPYYRPVVRTSLLVQKTWHGDDPFPFHLFNALLAGAAVWLAYRLLSTPAFGIGPVAALGGALLVGVHPAASSCVYPISSGRETLLPGVLILLTMWLFLDGRLLRRAASVAACGLALFAKEQAIVLPALLLLADGLGLVPPGRPPSPRAWFVRHAPFAFVTGIYLFVRWRIFDGGEVRWALSEHPLGPVESFAYALQTLAAPFVELVYEPPVGVWYSPARLGLGSVMMSALFVGAWRLGTGGRAAALFWAGWFVLTLLPTANLLRQEARFDERYVWLASVAAVGWFGAFATSAPPRMRQALVGALAVLVICGATVSWRRSASFRGDLAFFRQWTKTDPANGVARIHLGLALQRRGDAAAAQAEYERVPTDDPQFVAARVHLGNALLESGRAADALAAYRRGLDDPRCGRHRPGLRINAAQALLALGRSADAASELRDAVAESPDHPETRVALADVLARRGDRAAARKALQEGIDRLPADSPRRAGLEALLQRLRD